MTIASGEVNSAAPRLLFDQNLAPSLVRKLADYIRDLHMCASSN